MFSVFWELAPSGKMADGIGEKLRLARETRGIALRDISDQTRISMRYLEAIDNDDYRRLPGGIFNRSFIRAYAKFVGYDENEAIEEYAREQESADDTLVKHHRATVYTDDASNQSRSPIMTLLLAIIILAVLSGLVWGGLYLYQHKIAPRTPPTQTRHGRGINRSSVRIAGQLAMQPSFANYDLKEDAHDFSV